MKKNKEVLTSMKDGKAITIPSNTNFFQALNILAENNILSLPIYDVVEKKCSKFIDVADLACVVVDVMKNAPELKFDEDKAAFLEMQESIVMNSLNLKDVADFSGCDAFISVKEEDPLLKAAELLAAVHQHRIAVVDSNEDFQGIITQFGLVEYLMECQAEKSSALKVKVKELKLPTHLLSIEPEKTALEAYKILKEKKLSALPVIKNNILVDVISNSDLTVWTQWIASGQSLRFTNLQQLNKNILEFLEDSRAQRDMQKKAPITCTLETTLEDVVDLMLLNNVHRVFVMSPDNIATSVVNFGDIIAEMLSH